MPRVTFPGTGVWKTGDMRIRRMLVAAVAATLLAAAACSDGDDQQVLFAEAETPVLVEVPSVVGKTVQFAAGVLSTIGSPAVVEEVEGIDGIADTVVEQVPAAGTLVTLGSPVVIRVLPDDAADWDPDLLEGAPGATATSAPPPTTVATADEEAPAAGTTTSAPATTAAPTTTTSPPATTVPPSTVVLTTAPVMSAPPSTTVSATTVAGFALSESAVLTSTFTWGENSGRVHLLQQVLGTTTDGVYGSGTRTAHLSALSARGLSAAGVPSAPAAATTTTAAVPNTTTTTTTTTTTVAPVTTTTLYNRSLGLITTGNSYSASLNVGKRDAWKFAGVAGAQLTVHLTSSDLDVHLRIYDPSDVLIGDNDNTAGTNSYLKVLLCTTGTYTITADGTKKSTISTSTTDYTVSLQGGAVATTESLAAYFASTTCE
ncbi:MAG: PASTA domain-containing protein [Actinomycetota bacterium]|nr:PASTA domain-containing protein [Actinomycetota bacterium]